MFVTFLLNDIFIVTLASRLANQIGGNRDNSMNSLMLKTGLSRNQLTQLAQQHNSTRNNAADAAAAALSSTSLSNMIQRKNSFDALMSLDFQSLQSIDNLANLFQAGGG